jgi:hypothetical protein
MGLAEILHAIVDLCVGAGVPHFLHDEIDKLASRHEQAPAAESPAEPPAAPSVVQAQPLA